MRVEKAKAVDQGAVTYAKNKLVISDAYNQASQQEKLQMVQDSEVVVRRKR